MPDKLHTLFEKPVDRHIEGVIKADDETDLFTEVSEYVVTKEIAKHIDELLSAYLTGGKENGVWVAGFFGSGKSHLLKILSLLLENRTLSGTPTADLFIPKIVDDKLLKSDIEKAVRIPSRSVRFNIDQKADLIAKDQTDALLAVFVKVFNELRGYYPKQGYIAELEADLDGRGQLLAFKQAYFGESKGRNWEDDRDIVHTLENETFARAYSKVGGVSYDEALQALDRKQASYKVSIESFAESVNAWLAKQPENFRLNFFVDEVGQFIGRNSKLMLNLQTIVESLATKCKGRAWLFVTSQGDLATIIGEMGTEANDFTKIQGRFLPPLNLTSHDVAVVICRRLLAKKPVALEKLTKLYNDEGTNLKTILQFGDGSRTYVPFRNVNDFNEYYPFQPYQFELLQESLIALSQHNFFTGRARSIGERSMLGILQDVVKSIANEPLGSLATFDSMFEGIRNALRADLQTAVQSAERNLGGTSALAVRVLKALFLVKFIKSFKSTPRNIAILLVDRCVFEMADHEQNVLNALNLLENNTYIQRNGDVYEFLTNDEQDVENEIKNTDIDLTDVSELLGEIVFDHVIGESKLRFDDNKQDYNFTRRLDGQIYKKREYDVGIHIASPMHENYQQPSDMVSQSMGKAELLVILPEDPQLFGDLKLYKQTAKYCQQNLSSSLPEARRRIIVDKQQSNGERHTNLHDRLEEAICKASIVLNGNDLSNLSSDAKTRIVKSFQDLVRFAFPSLRMLRTNFTESELTRILTTPADDFFKNDDGTLGEAEQEILLKLKLAKTTGQRVVVSNVIANFEKRPYGWPQMAALCLTARLFMRGKVELRNGGNSLTAEEALPALTSNRQFGTTQVTLQEVVDAAALAGLKAFHQEFFHTTNPGTEAKEAALAFQKSISAEVAELEKLASHASAYPFMADLLPLAQELKAIADREWSHCLNNLSDFKEKLLNAKEDTVDPLKQFYSGQKRVIYDDVSRFLHDQEANFAELPGEDVKSLRAIIDSPTSYKGNALQQAKSLLDSLRAKVASVVDTARADARTRLQQALDGVQAAPEFADLDEAEKKSVLLPMRNAIERIDKEPLAPVVRQLAERTQSEILPRQLQEVSAIAAKKKGPGSGAPAVQYIAARSIPVAFAKGVIETQTDLDTYLAAVGKAYAAELENHKRITL